MDEFDRRLLRLLQADSARPIAEMAERVGLSPSACHRRIRALESAGVIAGYRAVLDPAALGLTLEVFVEIALSSQSEAMLRTFEDAVERAPEILECWLTAGRADYQLRLTARDMADYDRIHRGVLARLPGVASMHSRFALRRIKPWRGYPVE